VCWDDLRLAVEVKRPKVSRALNRSGDVSIAFTDALMMAMAGLATTSRLHIEVSPDLELLRTAARGRAPDIELAKSLGRETGAAVRAQLGSTQSPRYLRDRTIRQLLRDPARRWVWLSACMRGGGKRALIEGAAQIEKTDAQGLIVLDLEGGGVQPGSLINPLARLLAVDVAWTRTLAGVSIHSKT
jgi:hypothetical protein